MTIQKKRFVIIDAMALAYKGYFAFINHPLSNSKGEPTSAVFGFLNQFFKILDDTKPEYLAIAFDSKEKTFRHKIYEKYKSSRAIIPDDLIPQIERLKEIIKAFNIQIYILPGYEADDLIGSAVKKAEENNFDAIAVTPDKDFIQLITDNIKLIKPGKTTDEIILIDKAKVKDKYGFEPIEMIDYLALVGDSTDDIPGVEGIGPKTAIPLIQEFGTIENIYNNIENISKAGVKKKLERNKENAFLSKKLATIITNVPFDFNIEETSFTTPNFDELNRIFSELEFTNFGSKLSKLFPDKTGSINVLSKQIAEEKKHFDPSKVNYILISSEEKAIQLADKLSKCELFVFDTETDGLNVRHLNLAGISFCMKPGEAYFIAINPSWKSDNLFQPNLSDRLALSIFIKIFKPIFENKSIKKVCQNGKYDIGVLRTFGIETENFYFDTMLASYLIDPIQKHGMDDLALKYLNYKTIHLTELIGTKKTPSKIFDVDLNSLTNYGAEDSDITYRLYQIFSKIIEKENLAKLAYEVEFPLVPVLENMERSGIKVDINSLKKLSADLQILQDNYTREIFNLAGTEFNINSTKQMQDILFNKLKLPITKKTKTGHSTDARALESLQGKHKIIDIILNYRQAAKLKSTYADALPKMIDPASGRIHTTFNQTVTATGRLSSLEPNLQNIPIRTELGKKIRKAFVARNENYTLLSADYSQIELRILASVCGDEYLLDAFNKGEDIHRHTAALVFEVDPADVTQDMRRKAKEVNFGILYGIGAFGLKTRLGISQRHAQEIIDNYFNTFKRVKEYIDSSIENARQKGYAETLLGRRRFLKNIRSNNRVVRKFEERVAINMPIQGTAADMIKIAMIRIFNELKRRNSKTKMVLQVHDELIFDMHKDEKEELTPIIKNLMETALPLNVSVVVDTGFGKNWLEAH